MPELTRRRRTGKLIATIVLGLVGTQACDRCRRPKKSEPCHPCDPVALLRDGGALGDLAPLPQAALETCADRELTETIEARWAVPTCPDKTAHYLVNALDWEGALIDDWQQQAGGSFACPAEQAGSGVSGCAAAPPGEQSIVGPAEMEPTIESSVAMLVHSELLPSPDAAAIEQDLPALIEQALDDTGCTVPQPVFYPWPCTAFLVSSEHVLTAAHCLPGLPSSCGGEATTTELPELSLVFDYLNPIDPSDPDSIGIVADGLDIVACGPAGVAKKDDWVLLQFVPPPELGERPAFPLPDASPDECDDVYLAGHPMGHPQYVTGTLDPTLPSAWIDDMSPGLFRATLDVITGYSGAPVFATEDDRLIGLLAAGRFLQSSGCDWVFECGAAGCEETDDHGAVIDLSAIKDELTAAIAGS